MPSARFFPLWHSHCLASEQIVQPLATLSNHEGFSPFFCYDASSGIIARGACILCLLKSRAGLHIRLIAKQVMVSGWDMVPEVHELLLQHMVVVLFVMELLSFMCPILLYRPRQAVACSYTFQSRKPPALDIVLACGEVAAMHPQACLISSTLFPGVHDLQTCSDDARWRHVISNLGRCHLIVHRCVFF